VEVHVEQGHLDEGNPLVYREFGHHVRMAYDPRQIGEADALNLLMQFLPRTVGAEVVHRAAV
jgi:hypothetical protein